MQCCVVSHWRAAKCFNSERRFHYHERSLTASTRLHSSIAVALTIVTNYESFHELS